MSLEGKQVNNGSADNSEEAQFYLATANKLFKVQSTSSDHSKALRTVFRQGHPPCYEKFCRKL